MMMKKLLILCCAFAAVMLSAKEYKTIWVEAGEHASGPVEKLVPADAKVDPAKMQSTAFHVECSEYGIYISVQLDEKDAAARNELEIFLAPEGATSYYQFYGFPFEQEMNFYPYGDIYGRTYPRLQRKNWAITCQKNDAGMIVRLFIDWKDFARFINTKNWKFGVFRSRNYANQLWQGKLHEPATWGTLVMPDLTPAQRDAIARRLMMDVAFSEDYFKFDSARYNNKTFAAWRTMAKNEIARLMKDEKMNWQEKLTATLDLLEIRRYIDTIPYSLDAKFPAWTFYKGNVKQEQIDWRGPFQFNAKENVTRSAVYTAPADSEGEIWITNFIDYTRSEKVCWRVERDGKVIKAGTGAVQPLNIKIGKMKKGDTFTIIYEPNGTSYKPIPNLAVEDLKHGMIPGPAVSVTLPGAFEAAPKRNPDGSTVTGYESRNQGHLYAIRKMCMNKKFPRIFFLGDSITDGLRGKGWKMIEHLRPVNLGISGDWTQNVLWRLDQGMFDECKPELVVLMIGTNNGRYSIEEVANGNKLILDRIHELSPETKILLLGIFPRGKKHPEGGRFDQINAILKSYADNKRIFYMDLTHVFIDKDRNVRHDLLPDGLHPGSDGNIAWMTAILPTLEKLLGGTK